MSLGLAALAATSSGNAATLSVNTIYDVVANDGLCSLREAITAVNNAAVSGNLNGECAAGDGNNDEIDLPAGTYNLTVTGAGEDMNASGDLDLRASMRIVGAGRGNTAIDAFWLAVATAPDRVLHLIGPGIQVSMQDLMITGGHAPDAMSAGGAGESGGGIRVDNANLELLRVGVFGNVAGRGADAPAGGPGLNMGGTGGAGGGLAASGSVVTITDCSFTANHGGVGGDPGGGFPPGNPGIGGAGGAISMSNSSALTVQHSSLSNNASGLGGLFGGTTPTHSGYGGALNIDSNSNATITQSAIDANASGNSSIGIAGGGIAVIGGGGLTLTQTSVTRNVSQFGGGLYASSAATLQMANVTFGANQSSLGGAMYLDNTAVNLDFATISGNSAATGSGIAGASSHAVQLRNSIVSNNSGGDDCGNDGNPQTYISLGYNATGNGCPSNGTDDIATTNPQLGSLSANGGLGDTMMPNRSSAAIDAGNCAASSITVDERNHPRPNDEPGVVNVADGCDIGAVERDDDIFWDGFDGQ